ncbi:MAG TPA: exosome complex RNA-binding protein Rrp4 [archaeon]|nr:exosome complex RNA-binding protein Rrp4 [archaeon]
MTLLKNEKSLVVPGTVIAKGLDFLPGSGSYRSGDEIRSKYLGLVRLKDKLVSIAPLNGVYMPKPGDGIVGVISEMQATFWIVNINSPYDAIMQLGEASGDFIDLQKTDLSSIFDIGDVIFAKILSVTKSKHVNVTMNDYRAKKLTGGMILYINSSKVPRVIGKEGSMIEIIKQKTGCQIVVGQNGVVWIKGEKEALAAKAVMLIEKESHVSGLTDRVMKLLEGV